MQRFFRAPMESITLYALVHIQEYLSTTFAIEFQFLFQSSHGKYLIAQYVRTIWFIFCCISESAMYIGTSRVRIWPILCHHLIMLHFRPHMNKMKKACCVLTFRKYILSAAIVLGSNIARALPTFCLKLQG